MTGSDGAPVLSGQCLCGAVKVTIPRPSPDVTQICHCIDCRQSSGCLAIPLIRVLAASFHSQGDTACYYVQGQSGAQVGRLFCPKCGSQLWDTNSVETDKVWVKAGLFPPGTIPTPTLEIFTTDMESWEVPVPGALLE